MPRGRIVMAGAALLLLAGSAGPARAQVSPGPLAAAHQELDTPLKCFACHGKGSGSLREHCLECHKEIAWTFDKGVGLHGQKGMDKCAECHPDHAGREFAMIAWTEGSPEKFDHKRTGWPLEGKHATAKCADCHAPRFQTAESVRLSPRKDKSKAWVGLDRACLSCHQKDDVHKGALGADCGKCHSETAWKPARNFDHAKTSYPLTGKHADVKCEKCHLSERLPLQRDPQGRPIPIYKPVPHGECSTCHTDPHAGKLGPACSRCHVTTAWAQTDTRAFQHDRTRFPLRGKHAAVRCAACHDARAAWGKKPPFDTCTACHADVAHAHPDPHAGTATLAGRKADCDACHDLEGWKPSTYTVARHASAAYPLEGKHAAVRCAACHVRRPGGVPEEKLGRSGVLIRMAHARCLDCHGQDHGTQLAKRPDKGACESCHTVAGWRPTNFTAQQHARLRLPLVGRHATIACAACHGPARKDLPALPGPETIGNAGVLFAVQEIECGACHVDPHAGRFAVKGARPKSEGCLACHDIGAFRPSRVDPPLHQALGVPLAGAHRAVPCDGCHTETRGAAMASSLVLPAREIKRETFAVADKRCAACHKDPHGGQFAKSKGKGACEACHNEDVFLPASRFDHAKDAGFSLEGAHAKVPCASCHPARTDTTGKKMTVYRPVPKECKACHGVKKT